MRSVRSFTLAGVVALSVGAVLPSPASAADVVLSGTIKSAAGEPMGGVTVSAKAEGETITTTVFTDKSGTLYFPALPAAKYRVWAQALGFETARGAVDLASARQVGPRAQAHHRSRAANPAAAGRPDARRAARGNARRRAHEAARAQQLHRLPHGELRPPAPVRRGRLERHHRADEARQRVRRGAADPAGERHPRLSSEGARRLPGARPRPGRKRLPVQATAAPERRNRPRRDPRIRRADRSRRASAVQHRDP